MRVSKPYTSIFCTILFLVFLTSCSKEYETETFENSSLVTVKIQGTPSQLQGAKLDIKDVQLKVIEDESNPEAWVSLNTVNMGIHDLTDITGDEVVTLVDFEEVPVGYVYSLRVVFGDQNAILNHGVTYQLDMTSCSNASANKVEKQLIANKLYDFVIELDVDGSVIISEGQAAFNPKMTTVLRGFVLF